MIEDWETIFIYKNKYYLLNYFERFPEDFMFQCNSEELAVLRSQFATSNSVTSWNHKCRTTPHLFTENGVAMLSSVLNSPKAIQINMAIMRIFTKLRSFLLLEEDLNERVTQLTKGTSKLFKIVFERLDTIESDNPSLPKERRRIGIKK